jgi:hypothetical protein
VIGIVVADTQVCFLRRCVMFTNKPGDVLWSGRRTRKTGRTK